MDGPLDIARPRADIDQRRNGLPAGDTREARPVLDALEAIGNTFLDGSPTAVETIAASFRAVAADSTNASLDFQVDAYKPVIDALLELQPDEQFTRYVNPATGVINTQSVWRDVTRLRERGHFGDLPGTLDEFEQQWRKAKRTEIERDEDVAARGNGVAAFIGGVGGALTDRTNIMTLPIGGFGKTVFARILTEGLVGAGVEAALLPAVQREREALGRRDLTPKEAARNVAFAGFGASVFRGAIEVTPVAIRALDPDLPDKDLAKAFAKAVPVDQRTPDQRAALFIINRSEQIREANPFVDTFDALDAHVGKMQTALDALTEGRIAGDVEIASAGASAISPPIRLPGGAAATGAARGFDLESVKAAIRGPESGGDDRAVNGLGSSAAGRYQFIQGTFVQLYQREFGVNEAAAQRAWAGQRFDSDVQERLMDRLVTDNANALQRAGIATDPGNLYLAHFAGSGKAVELLRAPPDAPVAAFFSKTAVKQNPTFLGGGKTVGEAIEIIRSKVGDPAQRTPVPLGPTADAPALRNAALDAERPVVLLDNRSISTATFRASEIDIDAELMQFKSGGDQFGVTDRLRSVEEFDSFQAGFVTVWEGLDGRRLIADGHQRLGLAKRVGARTGEDIQLNAYILRESDGITATDARRITALRNVAEGSGTKLDAAKVFRDLSPEDTEIVLRRMARGGEFIKDAQGLARLEKEALGAVVNDVLPENYGASIGQLVDDPALHVGMVRILADAQPPNRRQAEAIIRQALDAGFVKETQDSLFGSETLMTGLFAQRAKLLDRALSELKRLKGAFGVAVRNAETLEAGGNRIDVAGSAAEVDANARALALVNALALRKGNAVNDLLTRAAERIAAGDRPADVLKQFVADVRKLDLDDLAGEIGDAGRPGAGDGAGRGNGDAADADSFGDGPGLFGDEPLTPRQIDEAAAARPRSDHSDLPPEPDPRFAEADSPGIIAATESAWHDIRMAGAADPPAVDPGIAARRADGDEAGQSLFDTVDQNSKFDLGDGRGERSVADIRAELDADISAIAEMRACLK